MSHVYTEHDTADPNEALSAVVLRLWDDLEQTLVAAPAASLAAVSVRARNTSAQRREAADVQPARVRYAFD